MASDSRESRSRHRVPAAALAITLAALAWSAYHPHDGPTWLLEVSPAVAAVVVLGATYRRFPLTPLAYVLIALHALVLIVGGHYTYAEVPLGDWVRDQFNLSRNPYDRLGHFMQGFVPAIAAREIMLRCTPLRPGWWLAFLTVSVCMAVSAVYELVEWLVAVIIGGAASNAFLGTQGDIWDTQKDLGMCLVGAATALLVLSHTHDRQIRRLEGVSHSTNGAEL